MGPSGPMKGVTYPAPEVLKAMKQNRQILCKMLGFNDKLTSAES